MKSQVGVAPTETIEFTILDEMLNKRLPFQTQSCEIERSLSDYASECNNKIPLIAITSFC